MPLSPVRSARTSSSVSPYTWEPSHQCVSVFTHVAGPPFASGDGSRRVRSIRIGCSNQGSSSAHSTSHGLSTSVWPWKTQSCTSNWIQDAARRFRVVAGMNSRRVRSSRLTSRGFGSSRRGGCSG